MQEGFIIKSADYRHYIMNFNETDDELVTNIPNKDAWTFLQQNMPLLDISEKQIELIWYFRWWTYRKHIKKTPDGYVITEFLPLVPWAGKFNTIACPAAHHIYEGRWLLDQQILDDYEQFWLRKGGDPRAYSFWIADAYYNRYLVNLQQDLVVDLLPDLIKNYKKWEKGVGFGRRRVGRHRNGLFFQYDGNDGGEISIGKHGFRPSINSYMYGDADAIAKIAHLANKPQIYSDFVKKRDELKNVVQSKLWDTNSKFFRTLNNYTKQLVDVKELIGLYPWYFNLPDPGYEIAWKEMIDPTGFFAPFGPTTAEQRHPQFQINYSGHECQWNGPSWPHATSIVITAMANLLNNYSQSIISFEDYFKQLLIYTKSHQRKKENGMIIPWIDENLNPYTGDWIARTRLKTWENGTWSNLKGGKERGKDYNHSTYNDLIITGLLGLRPRADNILELNPLIPKPFEFSISYFCLDRILYHHQFLTILWDLTGERYKLGAGFRVYCNGAEIYHQNSIEKILFKLEL
jgi:hypothetical protein